MTEFDTIYLIWKPGTGKRRKHIGILKRTSDGDCTFSYLPEAAGNDKNGLCLYTEFRDLNKCYTENVAEIFGQRLMKANRPDIGSFYSFWEVDTNLAKDKFYLLGKTQGLVPTDNFEFLAEYKYSPELVFLTEIAGLSAFQLSRDTVKIGDKLQYTFEKDNPYDQLAVKVCKNNIQIGYIKTIHNKIFHEKPEGHFELTVKAIEQNGILKRVFVRVSTH